MRLHVVFAVSLTGQNHKCVVRLAGVTMISSIVIFGRENIVKFWILLVSQQPKSAATNFV